MQNHFIVTKSHITFQVTYNSKTRTAQENNDCSRPQCPCTTNKKNRTVNKKISSSCYSPYLLSNGTAHLKLQHFFEPRTLPLCSNREQHCRPLPHIIWYHDPHLLPKIKPQDADTWGLRVFEGLLVVRKLVLRRLYAVDDSKRGRNTGIKLKMQDAKNYTYLTVMDLEVWGKRLQTLAVPNFNPRPATNPQPSLRMDGGIRKPAR